MFSCERIHAQKMSLYTGILSIRRLWYAMTNYQDERNTGICLYAKHSDFIRPQAFLYIISHLIKFKNLDDLGLDQLQKLLNSKIFQINVRILLLQQKRESGREKRARERKLSLSLSCSLLAIAKGKEGRGTRTALPTTRYHTAKLTHTERARERKLGKGRARGGRGMQGGELESLSRAHTNSLALSLHGPRLRGVL